MDLQPGARLGPYEIVAPLGAGGMGEVYRARDTKLGRDVALKTLPSAFTADVERVARFRREAQVLAALNHPHIAAIHGIDEAGGCQFLVLELADGETLADRLSRGALPVDETLDVARQVADALEAAHEKGIVPRSEAGEHRAHRRRPREGARFRPGQSARHTAGRRPIDIANTHVRRDAGGHHPRHRG